MIVFRIASTSKSDQSPYSLLVGGSEDALLMLNDFPPMNVSHADIEGFVRELCMRYERDSHDT